MFFFVKPMNLEISKSGERLNLLRWPDSEHFEMLSTLKSSWLMIVECKIFIFSYGIFKIIKMCTPPIHPHFLFGSGRFLIYWRSLLPRHYHCCYLIYMLSVRVENQRHDITIQRANFFRNTNDGKKNADYHV